MGAYRAIPFEDEGASLLEIKEHPGYIGVFTRGEYPGAYRNGTRVKKTDEDPSGDGTPLGSVGTVLGSVGHPDIGYAYFIEWDKRPGVAVFCVHWKIGEA